MSRRVHLLRRRWWVSGGLEQGGGARGLGHGCRSVPFLSRGCCISCQRGQQSLGATTRGSAARGSLLSCVPVGHSVFSFPPCGGPLMVKMGRRWPRWVVNGNVGPTTAPTSRRGVEARLGYAGARGASVHHPLLHPCSSVHHARLASDEEPAVLSPASCAPPAPWFWCGTAGKDRFLPCPWRWESVRVPSCAAVLRVRWWFYRQRTDDLWWLSLFFLFCSCSAHLATPVSFKLIQ